MARGYFETPADRELLHQVVQAKLKEMVGNRGRPAPPVDLSTAPEMFLVWVPSSGIPSISDINATGTGSHVDDVVGVDCNVYKKVTAGSIEEVQYAGFSVKAYNFSHTAITGNQFAQAWRDKFGTWYASPLSQAAAATGGAGGSGAISLASMSKTVSAPGTDAQVTGMTADFDTGSYVSGDTFVIPATGKYQIGMEGRWSWSGTAAGDSIGVAVKSSGTPLVGAAQYAKGFGYVMQSCSRLVSLASGTVLTAYVGNALLSGPTSISVSVSFWISRQA